MKLLIILLQIFNVPIFRSDSIEPPFLTASNGSSILSFRNKTLLFMRVLQFQENGTNNCRFIGIQANKKTNLLQYSICDHLAQGWMSLDQETLEFRLIFSGKPGTYNLSIMDPQSIDLDSAVGEKTRFEEEPEQEMTDFSWSNRTISRWWNFEKGEFVMSQVKSRRVDYAELSEEQKEAFLKWKSQFWQVSEEFEEEEIGVKSRPKRGIQVTSSEKYLELAIIADEGMWNLYVARYKEEAEVALNNFIDAVVDTAQLLWQLQSISPQLNFKVSSKIIWKDQPSSVKISTGSDAIQYLRDSCMFFRPMASGVDHVTIITGYDVKLRGNAIGGLSFTSAVCSDASCSLINAGRSGFRAGFTLAHEIGHSVSMKHDGDFRYQETKDCDNRCCIMTPFASGSRFGQGSTTVWSSCSKTRYHQKLVELSMSKNYCLENVVITDPIDNMPGQSNPAEIQCHVLLGTCSRADPATDHSDCGKIQCTENNGETSTVYSVTRIDGTYCGPGKVCVSGICASTKTQLIETPGAWSEWRPNSESRCGGTGCSTCRTANQTRIRIEVRRCDSPTPNNNGQPCMGNSVRALKCSDTHCDLGDDLNTYIRDTCLQHTAGSVPSPTQDTQCTFSCQISGTWVARHNKPNGNPCEASGRIGVCVNGQCLLALCSSNFSYFVKNVLECPQPAKPSCTNSEWSMWGECSSTCGIATRRRSRTIRSKSENGSVECLETTSIESEPCSNSPCSVNCKLSQWLAWSQCSVSCGFGAKTRVRFVISAEKNNGKPCSSVREETGTCKLFACPSNCSLNSWLPWSRCSATCGAGFRTRQRTIQSEGRNGGILCDPTKLKEKMNCDSLAICPPVPVDCLYSAWSAWSSCNATCGNGTVSRFRNIKNESAGNKTACSSDLVQTKQCEKIKCAIDCKLRPWSEWSACTESCGLGETSRYRNIMTNAVSGGSPCDKLRFQSKSCLVTSCPLDCTYGQWRLWSPCSTSCGVGTQIRNRIIVSKGSNGGQACETSRLQEKQRCNKGQCQTACKISSWATWSTCTATCGGGISKRRRILAGSCNENQASEEDKNCNEQECTPKRCIYTPWRTWSACSTTCGKGTRRRYRKMLLGCPNYVLKEEGSCIQSVCPPNCYTTNWTEWSRCSITCGANGKRLRTRKALKSDGSICGPEEIDSTSCNLEPCKGSELDCVFTLWSEWSRCSRYCGTGKRFRRRNIRKSAQPGGKPCPKTGYFEFENCINRACAMRDSLEAMCPDWGPWSRCKSSCGARGVMKRTRQRQISHDSGSTKGHNENNMYDCPSEEFGYCFNLFSCESQCEWAEWTSWTECQDGTQRRYRSPIGRHGPDSDCTGSGLELRLCTPK